jgi:D-tagatose-1,6-bisphosphate aldolase subunit GatZ/KbaZ
VIGTEVPVPGGAHAELQELAATRVEDLARTLAIQRQTFAGRGLAPAWQRVIGVVVQPGVEFDHSAVVDYQAQKARALSTAILDYPGLAYEAHSTDYQTEAALTDLVHDHFAILKVGPALTYAAREAIFALSYIEEEWLAGGAVSNIRRVLDERMRENPQNWDAYYAGSAAERAFARKYSFSDRSRYYWTDAAVEAGVETLFRNLSERPPPLTVLSQFMPNQYAALRAGRLANHPRALARHRIGEVISGYARACGWAKQITR